MVPWRKTAASDSSPKTNTHDSGNFAVVGIGASAGGLEALEEFFTAMSAESCAVFVVVTHLGPDHVSLLPDLLARKTTMTVVQVEDGMRLSQKHVYVIPPNKEMAVENGKLKLFPLSRSLKHVKVIDSFFRSLARDQGERAIGIVLSGTGTDGSLGIRAIKAENGMAMAQQPDSAKHDGMPKNVIATGLVDFVLPPKKMAEELFEYIEHRQQKKRSGPQLDKGHDPDLMQKIFHLLRAETKHDFSLYKKSTINRRIERRMHVHRIDTLEEYVLLLQHSRHEIKVLFKELLIGVTSFFREKETFELLKNTYLPQLLQQKTAEYSVRVWVPGCSTGQEAYSLAIIFTECMELMGLHFDVQIFATDIDSDAINIARIGVYPESIAAGVGRERLARFFTQKDDNSYQVMKNLREMIVFAQQNITKDPPFTKLDLLCCHNVLIYFDAELQKKVLPVFHYSLNPEGLLVIGSSESIGSSADLFRPLDKKHKIFKRLSAEVCPDALLQFPSAKPVAAVSPERSEEKIPKLQRDISSTSLLKTILAQSNMPCCVVIDEAMDVIYTHGRTGCFLEPAEGKPSFNLLKMARAGLAAPLTAALRQSASDGTATRASGVRVDDKDDSVTVHITIKPLLDSEVGRGLTLVTFEEEVPGQSTQNPKETKTQPRKKSAEVRRLEDTLRLTRENLSATIEELEISNEELKSANEELQSTNEELQSTNEELETSKEELQSLNEESSMVNAELQSRIDELVAANDDIKNLLEATEIATIFLDINFNVRRFTTTVIDIFPLTHNDIGRPIRHFASNLQGVNLQHYAEQVLADLAKRTTTVSDDKGKTYRMCLRPYRTTTNVIDGIVITFEDITELMELFHKARRLAAVVEDSNDAVTLQNFEGTILDWNKGAVKMYGYSEAEALHMNIRDITPDHGREDLDVFYKTLQNEDIESLRTERLHKNGTTINVWLTVTRLLDAQGKAEMIATTERDITKLRE